MIYDKYKAKLEKLKKVLRVIRRFRVLILSILGVILTVTTVLLSTNGIIYDTKECNSASGRRSILLILASIRFVPFPTGRLNPLITDRNKPLLSRQNLSKCPSWKGN